MIEVVLAGKLVGRVAGILWTAGVESEEGLCLATRFDVSLSVYKGRRYIEL